MPQQTSFKMKLNFEPSGGTLTITPLKGKSLDTIFQIALKDFFDEDQPLSYKYLYYTDGEHYEKERKQGGKQLQNYRNLYQDFSNQNTLNMTLPTPKLNKKTNKHEVLIMVTVSDSLGAIANVTQTIEIEPFSSSSSTLIKKIDQIYKQS